MWLNIQLIELTPYMNTDLSLVHNMTVDFRFVSYRNFIEMTPFGAVKPYILHSSAS